MSFLTDLAPDDRIELRIGESLIKLKVIKRTGMKVRLSISAGKEVDIKKIDSSKPVIKDNCQEVPPAVQT
jgi:sRNA-binding carbon storage regulator CsrA